MAAARGFPFIGNDLSTLAQVDALRQTNLLPYLPGSIIVGGLPLHFYTVVNTGIGFSFIASNYRVSPLSVVIIESF